MKLIIEGVVIVVVTGFFAMLEASMFTVSLSRARVLAAQKKRGADALLKAKLTMARSIFLLVVFMNVSTVIGSILIGKDAGEEFAGSVAIVSLIMTFAIILFGELIPKSIGDKYAEKIGMTFAPVILVITKIFSPIVWLYEKLIKLLIGTHTILVSEDDLRVMSETSHAEGEIELDEKRIILNTFEMNDTLVRDIMTPRGVVEFLSDQCTLTDALAIIGEKPFSRIPVYGNDLDDIVGVVTSKDILRGLARDEHSRTISEFMKPVKFIPETVQSDHLLVQFQKLKTHCAIVIDENEKTVGFVTLEDVLEVLVGEIMDETDEHEDMRNIR
ncbi:MAG: hypothetical protein JWM20_333 [Patescibacteria group bacterium]|nr:hypothetical protein [Patescibacteria group bacterium]